MDRQAEVSPTAKALIVRVVDDDPLVLHNTTVALEDAGHEPDRIFVRPGRARYARGQAREWTSWCCRLPHARHERPAVCGESARSGRTCPILIASAYGDLSSSDLKLPELQKPFTLHELLQVISATLNDADRDGSNVHVLRRRPPAHRSRILRPRTMPESVAPTTLASTMTQSSRIRPYTVQRPSPSVSALSMPSERSSVELRGEGFRTFGM